MQELRRRGEALNGLVCFAALSSRYHLTIKSRSPREPQTALTFPTSSDCSTHHFTEVAIKSFATEHCHGARIDFHLVENGGVVSVFDGVKPAFVSGVIVEGFFQFRPRPHGVDGVPRMVTSVADFVTVHVGVGGVTEIRLPDDEGIVEQAS